LQRVALLCLSRANSKKLRSRWIPVEAHHLVRTSAFSPLLWLYYTYVGNAAKGNKFRFSLTVLAPRLWSSGRFFGTSCLVLVVVIELSFAIILKTVRICGRQTRTRDSAAIALINSTTWSHPLIVLFCEVSVYMKWDFALGSFFVPVRPVKVDRAGRKDDRLKISILTIRLKCFLGSSIRVRVRVLDVYVCMCMCTSVSFMSLLERVRVLNVR